MKVLAALAALVLLGCSAPAQDPVTDPPPPTTAPPPTLMPDLTGLPTQQVARALGRLERQGVDVSGNRGAPVAVRCGVRPGVVVRQRPAPGTPVEGRVEGFLRLSALDLRTFRGPCLGADLGPVDGADAALARHFYRFATDPTRDVPFVDGEVWAGIEAGPTGAWLDATERTRLSSWRVGTGYAERSDPLSALDLVASSGGWYELHPGVVPTCGTRRAGRPGAMAGLRAITLRPDPATTGSCMDTWGVTLFLDETDRIAGVALRIGSP